MSKDTRSKITFRKDIYCFLSLNSQYENISFAKFLNNILRNLSSDIIDKYHDVSLENENKDYVPHISADLTRKKDIRFPEDLFEKITNESKRYNKTFSQYINFIASAAMNFDNAQRKDTDNKKEINFFIDDIDYKYTTDDNTFNFDDTDDNYYSSIHYQYRTNNETDDEEIDDDKTESEGSENDEWKNDIIKIDENNSILKSESIIGMPDDKDKLTVFKSELMYSLISKGCNLTSLKLFDVILGRLNPMDPQKNTVVFSKKELEEASNIKRITREQMNNYLKQFMRTIEYNNGAESLYVNLFSKGYTADCGKQSWKAIISCTRDAGFFFQLSNYAKYPLSDIIQLTSIHQYTLFQYLIFNIRFGKSKWSIDIDKLKEIMDCKSETYSMNKRFIENKLKPTVERINSYTSLNCSYKTILENGTISKVEFDIHRKPGVSIPDLDNDVLKSLPAGDNKPDDSQTIVIDNIPQDNSNGLSIISEVKNNYDTEYVLSNLKQLAVKYLDKVGWQSDSFDSADLKQIFDYIFDCSDNKFSVNNILSILSSVIDKLISDDCFTVSRACDYFKSAFDILVYAELDTVIESPVKYLKGIIKNGHPEKSKKDWFTRINSSEIKNSSPKFIEREFSNEDLNYFLEMSLKD